jgi:hypothetical protein
VLKNAEMLSKTVCLSTFEVGYFSESESVPESDLKGINLTLYKNL